MCAEVAFSWLTPNAWTVDHLKSRARDDGWPTCTSFLAFFIMGTSCLICLAKLLFTPVSENTSTPQEPTSLPQQNNPQ